ncbi:SDR family oxidoreductase [Rubrivivax gelatinosus]|uniref:NADP-dependent 3-hydroxy acid dehydrogenase YdfG n=1 Tax=Rubrivivax gelatinosus TaxID=28068 RepID=A0A4R2MCR7_RUBGE|nr:SDR family oxidoreductase [Rubrivivax gelatinosus]MBK1686415.1 short-chain dehydrogenase [Rubrivivax gelatinosus]TCP04360.1 NADP-dependent 3-hydroxy acid dehydrogenase YdfG [Rubrivivax gelatinosus]
MSLPALLAPSSTDAASLRGRVVVVTGGARGLGAAIAQVLGESGARVVLADHAIEAAQDRAAVLAERDIDAIAMPLDVTDAAACERTVEMIRARFGRLDALVNNAAIDVTAPLAELSNGQIQSVLATNLAGPFVMAKLCAALMAGQDGGGHIVNIASTASKRAWPNASAYHATKWGLLGLSHALHAELRPQGIKVCAIVAGGMRTPFLLDRFPELDPGLLQDPLNVARVVRFVLLQPEETAIPEVTVLPMRETSWP